MEEKEEQREAKTDKPTPLLNMKKGPPREQISKEETIRRMRTIDEWRKERLEQLRAKLQAEGSG